MILFIDLLVFVEYHNIFSWKSWLIGRDLGEVCN